MRPTVKPFVAMAFGVTVTVLAACTVSAEPSPGSGAVGAAAAVSDATALSFIGGTAGPADPAAPPVRVGFINQDTGVPSFPEATAAASSVTSLINDRLGGINGHRLDLVMCSVDSEAKGQACAQKMLNDPSISVIQTGAMAVGNVSVYRTIAGAKPILGGNPITPSDFTADNTYFFTSGAPGVHGAIANYVAHTVHAKSTSVVYSDDPGGSAAGSMGSAGLKAAGIRTTDIAFASSGGDLTAPLTAAGAQTAEVIYFLTAGPACLQMAHAQKQLALRAQVISVSLCLDPSVKQQLGDFPKWTFGASNPNTLVDGNDPQVNLFRSVMAKYAPGNENFGGFGPATFGSLLDLAKIMNAIGYDRLGPEVISTALATYRGSAFLGAPAMECGFNPKLPTLCTPDARLYSYDGDGTWTDVEGGRWVGADQ